MTYEELKSKINDLLHTRYRAQIINDLAVASKQSGYDQLFDYLEFCIRTETMKPRGNGIPKEVKRDGLRKYFGLTNGQISGATSAGKLECHKRGRENVYPTSQTYLQRILSNRENALFS